LRLAAPFAVILLLLIYTVVARSLQDADPGDLTPTGTGGGGGSRLAQLLTAQGIEIQRVTNTPDALTAAGSGNVTLFIPAPARMHPDYLHLLNLLPAYARVVLVAPSDYTLESAGIPIDGTGSRWATAAVEPGCVLPEAVDAGTAAVHRARYRPSAGRAAARCYRDSLVSMRVNAVEVMVIGASDPFRNNRIGEHGNAALATGLLSQHPRVVWLELHGNEPPPAASTPPNAAPRQSPAGPGDVVDSATPDGSGDGGQGDDGSGGGSGGDQSSGQSPPLPVPVQFWAVLALLVAAMLAVAVARARRLGPPVVEPLPVTVRGLETVTGRGHLYRRARARGWALDILRAAALRRVLAALELGPDPAAASVVGALAERTGRPADEIDAILYGPEPTNDAALVRAADELDALMRDAFPDVARGETE
jgi:hypothetical protein